MTTLPQTVAIVGAGIAGLCCARELQAAGLSVVVFDKSRGVGGRVATRRGEEGAVFDHGAQYFTVKDPRFQQQVDDWLSAGVVARWPARIGTLRGGIWTPAEAETSRYVGVPAMTAIAKQMASDLEIHFQTPIQSIAHDNGHWKLVSDQERMFGPFDAVLSTAPAPQTKSILGEYAALFAGIERVEISPCWALKLVLAEPLPVPMDGAFVEDCPLSWIARNSSKPGRARVPECWVLHASPAWSKAHLEEAAESVADKLLAEFWGALGTTPAQHLAADAHRWRYALPIETLAERCVYDRDLRLGVGGDWCGGPRVEGAYLSGLSLAQIVLETRK
jgi:predicted NAD/FAD-dependent oxidoreductase